MITRHSPVKPLHSTIAVSIVLLILNWLAQAATFGAGLALISFADWRRKWVAATSSRPVKLECLGEQADG